MGAPITIDADTHVDETENTWEYMLPNEKDLKPEAGFPSGDPDPNRPPTRYWIIDGQRQPRLTRTDEKTHTTVETRELLDVKERLIDMDELEVQTQVIFPTTMLIQTTTKPGTDLALKRSYNRWMGDRCAQSGGRLRWVALLPTMTMEECIKEVRWAKDHGAVGVFKKGDKEGDKYLADPYFYDLWKEVNDLEMCVCFHAGSGVYDRIPAREASFAVGRLQFPVIQAFQSLVQHQIPQQYPKIHWGFIEAGASWVPFVIYNLVRRLKRPGENQRITYDMRTDALKEFNLFVTCQVDEDLPYILQYAGEDNIIVGSDYCHADQSAERDFQLQLRKRTDISAEAVDKILVDNPKRLYRL